MEGIDIQAIVRLAVQEYVRTTQKAAEQFSLADDDDFRRYAERLARTMARRALVRALADLGRE